MIKRNKQWLVGIVIGLVSSFVGFTISILTWQYPKYGSTPVAISIPVPSLSDYETAASRAVESYFREAKLEELEKKYVRTFNLTSEPDEGWVDTGIVLQRNHKIFITQKLEEGESSANYWAVRSNLWDSYAGSYRVITSRWDDEGDGSGEIETNFLLGKKKQDTLKLCAYWVNHGPVTVEVITDYDKYSAESPDKGESCPY